MKNKQTDKDYLTLKKIRYVSDNTKKQKQLKSLNKIKNYLKNYI